MVSALSQMARTRASAGRRKAAGGEASGSHVPPAGCQRMTRSSLTAATLFVKFSVLTFRAMTDIPWYENVQIVSRWVKRFENWTIFAATFALLASAATTAATVGRLYFSGLQGKIDARINGEWTVPGGKDRQELLGYLAPYKGFTLTLAAIPGLRDRKRFCYELEALFTDAGWIVHSNLAAPDPNGIRVPDVEGIVVSVLKSC